MRPSQNSQYVNLEMGLGEAQLHVIIQMFKKAL